MTFSVIATLMLCMFLRGGESLVDNCETKQIEMNIVRTLPVSYGGRSRNAVCVANVLVNECDGTCVSRVTPSVSQFPGFDKICKCCSESRLITREITLTECRDGNQVLENVHLTTSYSEPAGCACQSCQN
ncbi:Partner of bursicon [Mizuhopecten yessoensis]|uniref:Bursicon beta n=1 Tax=Mizuhopecten yessoensis TaxID=6573 RepID=A0A210R3A7_MIZYE|nr:bursicon beta [Mizuhopecten yessoensis]OWF55487.1 Partner of bursicon [Mizuhopecten yessoensis]